jgi:hypothetical protein
MYVPSCRWLHRLVTGTTTLLSQWAEGGGRSFAWVSADETDRDPKVLLGYAPKLLMRWSR